MFGKKKTPQEKPAPKITAKIDTMPSVFYGGADPVIYKSSVSNSAPTESITAPVRPSVPPPPPVPKPAPKPTASSPLQKPVQKSRSKWIIIVILLLVALLGISAYFLYPYLTAPDTPEQNTVSTPPPAPVVVPPPVPVAPTTTPTSSVEQTPTTTPTSSLRGGGRLSLPSVSYAVSPDDDADTLSDLEELVFQTDPGIWDTDKDGYYDGLEVINLYNPKGIAPQKLIDSGLVKEYISPVWQYRVYYPSTWRVDSVDVRGDDILISGNSGDYIEIRAFKKDRTISFASWFSDMLPNENIASFKDMKNRFQIPAKRRMDGRVAFFETDTAVYSVVYFLGEEEKNAYAKVMEVAVQSFRPGKQTQEIPEQVILPGVSSSVPMTTSSTEISTETGTSTSILNSASSTSDSSTPTSSSATSSPQSTSTSSAFDS